MATSMKIPEEAVLREVLQRALDSRREGEQATELQTLLQREFAIDSQRAAKLDLDLRSFARGAVWSPSDLSKPPPGLPPQLSSLLVRLLQEMAPVWRAKALSEQAFLPRFENMTWKVVTRAAGDGGTLDTEPVCCVQLQIRKEMGHIECLPLELEPRTVDTMLDSLGRVRDQLANVARR
uniref:COMM domain-containing protein n=1 Tax=Eptatretus burgeri TaxID=7764 RepID=A0A8C4Q0Q5_EPTBU